VHRLVIASVTLIGLIGAAVVAGYFFLFAAVTDEAAGLAPRNTAVYVNVYLQPSTGQQMNLGELIGRLPGFADDASLDEKVDQVVQNLLSDTGIDYREQVKPWLGNQVAVAGWTADDAVEPVGVVIAEVKDRAAAEASLADFASEASAGGFTAETYAGVELQVGDGAAYAFVEEMVVMSDSAAPIQAAIDSAGGESLAGRDDFQATMADLPEDHLASVFVDLAALAESTGAADQLAAVSTAGAALVAEPEGLRLSGSAPFDSGQAAPSSAANFALGSEPSSLVDWMPESTVAELVIFGLRQTLEDAETAIGSTPEGEELTSSLDTLRALAAFGLGVDLDDDILPLLDREVAVAVAGLGEDGLPSGQLLLRPDDAEAAADALGRLADGLAGTLNADVSSETIDGTEIVTLVIPDVGEVAYALADGIVILGMGRDDVTAALEAHADGTTLGASDAYRRTFEVAGERAGNEAFVDVGAAVALLGLDATLSEDERDILAQIGTFGFTAPSRENEIEFHAVLTVEDARPQ
jgi:hypothetical protein